MSPSSSLLLLVAFAGTPSDPWPLVPADEPAPVAEQTAGGAASETNPALPGTAAQWLSELEVQLYGNFLANRDDQRVNDPDGNQIDDRMRVREVDVDFRYDVSESVRAAVILSYESDPVSSHESDLAEAWIGLDRPLGDSGVWDVQLRAGKFRTAFGQNARLRLFEIPQPTRPLAVRYYLGEDGLTSTGVAGRLGLTVADDHVFALHAEAIDSGDLPLTDAVGEQPFLPQEFPRHLAVGAAILLHPIVQFLHPPKKLNPVFQLHDSGITLQAVFDFHRR